MQYRAYKDVSATFSQMMNDAPLMVPRTVGVDPDLQGLLPDVVLGLGPDASRRWPHWPHPETPAEVDTDHIHSPQVSVAEQKEILAALLQEQGHATFRDLIEDADSRMVVVGRFLALLELYRDGTVRFEQEKALAQLTIVWEDSSDRSGD